jgi:hypothetical protein
MNIPWLFFILAIIIAILLIDNDNDPRNFT